RSGEELWAEICSSCVPGPERGEGGDAFADSFLDWCGPRQPSPRPWEPLGDSEVYLAALERRLMRLKGLSQEVTSKDMLRTLSQAKKECWDRFLQEKFEAECYVEGHDADESTLEHLRRWLQPDKVAISSEEVQCLIPPEPRPEKPEAEEESPAAEQ
ncbi:CCD32 protein, partial [Pitta sordida]|nr:CCD32 protein [Pitta sordida]